MLRANLIQRIVLPVGAVALLLQLGLAAYTLEHERGALLNQIDTRANRLAETARAFDLSGESMNADQVAQWLGTTLLEQDDVLFCEVSAGHDRVLFRGGSCDPRASRGYAFALLPPDRPAANDDGIPSTASTESRIAPGSTLYLTLSTARIEHTLGQARGALTIAILAGTATMLLLTTLLVRSTVRHAVADQVKEREAAFGQLLDLPVSSANSNPLEQLGEVIDTIGARTPEVSNSEGHLTYGQMHPADSTEEQAVCHDQNTPVTSTSERAS
jgi:hypothetical protein